MSQDASNISLINAIDLQLKAVRTASLDVSFNELLDMKKNGELRIDPEYQRLFRWSQGKQSRFIESLILEMPIPPIYVIEEDSGKYELIDGLQRISSYLHFRGELTASHMQIQATNQLTLTECDIVEELNGKTFSTLPEAIVIKLKRRFVRMEVLRKESDRRLRYHMFKRLNTGGETLSDQEIRNCTIRLLDNTFNDFIIRMSIAPDFQACTQSLTDEQKAQRYEQELVLRFFTFKNDRARYSHDIGDFLTEYMEGVSDPQNTSVQFDYQNEEALFLKTCRLLNMTLGESAFSRVSSKNLSFIRGFAVYHFEAFTLGLQEILPRVDEANQDHINRLNTALTDIKQDQDFINLTTGGGKNSRSQLNERIRFVSERLTGVIA